MTYKTFYARITPINGIPGEKYSVVVSGITAEVDGQKTWSGNGAMNFAIKPTAAGVANIVFKNDTLNQIIGVRKINIDTLIPTYNLLFTSDSAGNNVQSSVNEGGTTYLVIRTTNVDNGTVINVTLTGIDTVDIGGGVLSFNLTVNNNFASQVITFNNDNRTDGYKSAHASAKVNGTEVASATIGINDTSIFPGTPNGDYNWTNGPAEITIAPGTTKYISIYPAGLSLVNGYNYDGSTGGVTGIYISSNTIPNNGYDYNYQNTAESRGRNNNKGTGGARGVVSGGNPEAYLFCWLPGWGRDEYSDVYDPYGGMFKWGALNQTKWVGQGWKSDTNKNTMPLDTPYIHNGVRVTNVAKLESFDWDKYEIGFSYKIKVENTNSTAIVIKALYGQYSAGYPNKTDIHGMFGGGDLVVKGTRTFAAGNRATTWGGSKMPLSCDGFIRISDS